MAIGQTVAAVWRRINFANMAAFRHLGLVVVFGPPTKSICGLYCCAKLGLNRWSRMDNIDFIYFTTLTRKCLFTPSFTSFRGFNP